MTFEQSSWLGTKSITQFGKSYETMAPSHPGQYPIVQLGAASKKTKTGNKFRPTFTIVGWMPNGASEPEPVPVSGPDKPLQITGPDDRVEDGPDDEDPAVRADRGLRGGAPVSPLRRYDVARALDLVRGLRKSLRKPEEIRIADLAADLIEAGAEAEEGEAEAEEAEAEAEELRHLETLAFNLAMAVVDVTRRKPSADDWPELRSLARDVLVQVDAIARVARLPEAPAAQNGATA